MKFKDTFLAVFLTSSVLAILGGLVFALINSETTCRAKTERAFSKCLESGNVPDECVTMYDKLLDRCKKKQD